MYGFPLGSLGSSDLPTNWIDSLGVNVCAWCSMIDWSLLQGVFLPHAQSFKDRHWIYLNLGQDNALTEDTLGRLGAAVASTVVS